MNASPKISVVIPAFNEEAMLADTLTAAHAACDEAGIPYELIVADNNSTDSTAQIATENGALVVRETHQQIAATRNTGASAGSGEWLIFVDADTTLTVQLVKAASAALGSGCVGGGALPVFDREVSGIPKLMTLLWHQLATRMRWACGAFVFCRRDAFEAVGGFDETYYCSEEIHLSRALQKWGKAHKRSFIIVEPRLTTSARKLDWYSPWQTVKVFLGLLVPGAMKKPSTCDFWYQRPEK